MKEDALGTKSYWMDALAFAVGLGVAGWTGWDTTGLVWGLWLSSLVVGYVMIIAHIVRGWLLVKSGRMSHVFANDLNAPVVPPGKGLMAAATVGSLFMLAFFSFHFGGFHWGHSIFLNLFFPVPGGATPGGIPGLGTYWIVVKSSAWFIPLALVAERAAFLPKRDPMKASMTQKELSDEWGKGMMAPYKNVVRLHLLIFFFAFAYGIGLKGAPIFVVVYAVYFFPWELVKKKKTEEQKAEE